MLYELASGRHPFPGVSAVDVMSGILKEDPPPIEGEFSPVLERIIRRCLEKEPSRRFQSSADLAFALQSVQGTSTAQAAAPATPGVAPRPTRRTALWAGGVAFAGALGFGAARWLSPGENPLPRYRVIATAGAQIGFDAGPQGQTTQAVLHQGGSDTPAKRLDEAGAKRAAEEIAARAAAVAKRFKDQTQLPGTEAALRRTIDELRVGQPRYDLMSPAFAEVTRKQLPQFQPIFAKFGSVESVTFKGVGTGGADIYEVKFEHGATEWRISLGPDGKIEGMIFNMQ